MRKQVIFFLFAAMFAVVYGMQKPTELTQKQDVQPAAAAPKYIFLFIGDGMSVPQRLLAEKFSQTIGNGNLVLNGLQYNATTRTSSANALVTDSAAAATAIACGEKTVNGCLGLNASFDTRLESSAAVAHRKGYKVGIVTSVTINHATPSGFYAHRKSRGELYGIGLDLISSDFEYFGGGGFAGAFDQKDDPEYKGNLYDLAAEAGYTICRDKDSILAVAAGTPKVLALACESVLPYAIDGQDNVPTLADFTAKGIELLDNPNGFFMMVEGGSIDYAGHANDAATNLREVLALNEAVGVAVEFQKLHPDETLIITTGDHETGGMTIGFAGSGYALYLERLVNQKCSAGAFADIVSNARKAKDDFSFEDAKSLLTQYFGFIFDDAQKDNPMFINEQELKTLQKAFEENSLHNAARIIIDSKAGIGWDTGGHTALPVLTASEGKCADLFTGFIENTDISNRLKSILNQLPDAAN